MEPKASAAGARLPRRVLTSPPPTMPWGRLFAALLAWLPVACGSSNFDGRVYRDDSMAFRVGPVPQRWRALSADHALLAFRDDPGRATIAVGGRCGKDGDDVPLQALTHHLFLHFTHREIVTQQELSLDGRAALRTEMTAALDGVPKRFLVYVLKKDGCVYDFMHIADDDAAGAERGDFERFVRGFSTLS